MKQINASVVVYTIVFLMLGFLLSYSYQLTSERNLANKGPEKSWTQEYKYRKLIEDQKQKNKDLQTRLEDGKKQVSKIEKNLASEKEEFSNLVEKINLYRMYLGEIPVKGVGVEVTLTDATYIPNEENVNEYLVHEQHIYKVINELYISGATAISINDQRLTKTSFIKCIGPVLSIDGNEHPAPFVVKAIGNPKTLESSLLLKDGIIDQLRYDQIDVQIKTVDNIEMSAAIETK